MKSRHKRRINVPMWRDVSFFGLLGLVLLFAHQNCAPAGAVGPPVNMATVIEAGGPVTVIDDYKKDAAVSFAAKQVQFNSSSSAVTLTGQCSLLQEGAVLGYRVYDPVTNAELAKGLVQCSNGSFSVPLSLDCNRGYLVRAQLGFAEPGIVEVSRSCGA